MFITCDPYWKYQITKDGSNYRLYQLSEGNWTLIEPIVVLDTEIRFDLKTGSDAIVESIAASKQNSLLDAINEVVPVVEGKIWTSLSDAKDELVFLEEVVSHKTIDFAYNKYWFHDYRIIKQKQFDLLSVRHREGYKGIFWRLYTEDEEGWFKKSSLECSLDFQE